MVQRHAGVRRCLGTAEAAVYLGVSPEALHRWRKRGIGPAYVRYPMVSTRDHKEWRGKRWGMIAYPIEELDRWIERRRVQAGRLPRPVPGRLPGGKNFERKVERGAEYPAGGTGRGAA